MSASPQVRTSNTWGVYITTYLTHLPLTYDRRLFSQFPAPILPPPNLPRTQPLLHASQNTHQGRQRNPGTITHTHRAQRELPLGVRHVVRNIRVGVDVDETTEDADPEDESEDDVDAWEDHVEGLKDQESEVEALEAAHGVKVWDSDEGEG